MQYIENFSLHTHNSFGFKIYARYFFSVSCLSELQESIQFSRQKNCSFLVLGGGSNIVLTQHFPGVVIYINFCGIEVISKNDRTEIVRAGAGENWHQFVSTCLNKGCYGLENLALIPGNVGAAPIQNIGAYGVELVDFFYQLEAMDVASGKLEIFDKDACDFDYRDSIFKNELKNKFVITSVTMKLNSDPLININYDALKREFTGNKLSEITPKNVFETVCHIRQGKLPDPNEIGNAGSFFKNPIISKPQFQILFEKYPDIVGFPVKNDEIKLAAGWLIEKAGWKGYRENNVGVHAKQALVLVNFGGANGLEILELAKKIQQSIRQRFDIVLEMEPTIIST